VTLAVVGLLVAGCPEPPAEIPDCGDDTLATQPPLDMADVVAVGPMGYVDPPRGPVFPGTAISLFLRPQDPRLPGGDPARSPVVAPVRLWVHHVWRFMSINGGRPAEFSIEARSCKQVTWRFDHLTSLTPALAKPLEIASGSGVDCFDTGGPDTFRCGASVAALEIAPGETLGLAGNWANKALDVSVRDSRVPPVVFANADRSQWTCPMDAFVPSIGDALRALPSTPDGRRRTVSPLCGDYMQDVPGTAAGNWGGPLSGLALVHDNVDPGTGVISVSAGLNSGRWRFPATGSGTVNRDFRQISGDDTVFCYDASAGGDLPGIVLIQLTGDGLLVFEQQPIAGCGSGPWDFTDNRQSFLR
jgi:hypothetical protein